MVLDAECCAAGCRCRMRGIKRGIGVLTPCTADLQAFGEAPVGDEACTDATLPNRGIILWGSHASGPQLTSRQEGAAAPPRWPQGHRPGCNAV
jgi:hypothetical protein